MRIEAGLLPRLCAERYADRAALPSLSFAALGAQANRAGSGMLAAGLSRGDRVGVLTP